MKLLKKIKDYLTVQLVIGIVLGAIAGYLYYYYIGCSSGTCPITSNPVNSVLYGMFFGGAMAFKKKKPKQVDPS